MLTGAADSRCAVQALGGHLEIAAVFGEERVSVIPGGAGFHEGPLPQ
jgi:hypothetical protein